MGVVLGVLTTKDGQTIPLPTAKDMIVGPKDEYRKEEEKRFRGCLRRPLSHAWGVEQAGEPITRQVALYRVKTQYLMRQGGTPMKEDKRFQSSTYRLFEAYFKNPNTWLSTSQLHQMTGVGSSSISTLSKRAVDFLISEGLMEEKEDPNSSMGRLRMFKGQCEKPEEEARIWYDKMLRVKRKKTPTAKGTEGRPKPQAPGASSITQVQVDMGTMEAILRVPLTKLAQVLKALE
jgi:hypothetical protein